MQSTNEENHATERSGRRRRVDPRVKYLERHLLEAFDELWDSFVDPDEAVVRRRRNAVEPAGRRPAVAGSGRHALQRRAATGRDPRPMPRPGRSPTSSPSTATKTASATSSAADTPIGPWPARASDADVAGRRSAGRARRVRPPEQLAQAAAGDRPPQGPRRRMLPAAVSRRRRHARGCDSSSRARWPRRRDRGGDPVGPPSASRPIRTTWRPCWATGSTAGWSTPPRSSTARRTSTPT